MARLHLLFPITLFDLHQAGEELQVTISNCALDTADKLQCTGHHRELVGAYCQVCEDGEGDEVSDNDSEYPEEDEYGHMVVDSSMFDTALNRARDFLFTLFSSSSASVRLRWL